MAKMKVVEKALVLSTRLPLDTIKRLEAIKPDALKITDDKGNELFVVKAGSSEAITNNGIVFKDSNKITILAPEGKELTETSIQTLYGKALLSLKVIEDKAMAAAAELNLSLADLIEFVDIDDEDEAVEATPETTTRRGRRAA